MSKLTGSTFVRPAPLLVGLTAFALASLFVALRLELVAGGDASRFVVAGSQFADPASVPPSLHVEPGAGYDGQFVWRMAAAPNRLGTERYLGVELDTPLRTQRIGLPLLGWLVSAGQVEWVPWALILVNLVAVGFLGWLGALIARNAGQSSWFGLVLTCVPGFAFTLSRDLNELLAAALLVAGIYAVQRGKWWWAALAWSAGVLTREQLLLAVGTYALWRLTDRPWRGSLPSMRDVPWIAPVITFVAWQATVWSWTGHLPIRSDTGANLGPPFIGIAHGVLHWVGNLGAKAALLSALELVFLVVLVVTALRTRTSPGNNWQRWIVGFLAVFALLLTKFVWDGPADLRTLTDLFLVAWVVLLSAGRRRTIELLGGAQVVLFAGAATLRIAAI